MVMVATVPTTSPLAPHLTTPKNAGGKSTSTTYLVVDDVDAHCAKAKAAGAEIIVEPHDQPQGRYYFCKDPEGYVWSFGSYNPLAAKAP